MEDSQGAEQPVGRAGKKKREGSEIFRVLYHQGVNQFPPLSSGGGYSPSSEMTPLSFFTARKPDHINELGFDEDNHPE